MTIAIYEKQYTALLSVEARTGRDLPNRRACKRIRKKKEGAFFQDLPTQHVMVSKRMIDLAWDKFFRSRGMPQKDSINSQTRLANDRESAKRHLPSGPEDVLSFSHRTGMKPDQLERPSLNEKAEPRFWKILTSHIDGMQRFKRSQGDGCMQFHPVHETGGPWKQVVMTSL